MKNIMLIALLLFCYSLGYGQIEAPSQTPHVVEADVGPWELGVDLLPLIDTSYFLPASVLLRYRLSDRLKLRARPGITFEERRNRPNSLPETNLLSGGEFGAYLSGGLEWYVTTGRVSVFFGAEIFGSFFRRIERVDTDTRPLANPPTIIRIRDYYSDQKYGLNGLAGMNVRIVPHFYIATEAYLQIAYRRQHTIYEEYRQEVEYATGGRLLKRYIAALEPISAIHLIYQF